MKTWKPSVHLAVPLFFLCAVGGWLAGHRPEMRNSSPPDGQQAGMHESRRRQSLPRTAKDLEAWMKDFSGTMIADGFSYRVPPPGLDEWTADELRAALEQGMRDPSSTGNPTVREALKAILSEWTRRDSSAAWTFFSTVKPELTQAALGEALANSWPTSRAREGWELMMAHPEFFDAGKGRFNYYGLRNRAVDDASRMGAAEVSRMLSEMRDHGVMPPLNGLHFAPGFDFTALANTPESQDLNARYGVGSFLLDAWMTQDPQAAFDGLVALQAKSGINLAGSLANSVMLDPADPGPMEERARWIAGKAGGLDEDQRRALNDGMAQSALGELGTMKVKAFLSGYGDPELKAQAGMQMSEDLLRQGNRAGAIELLDLSSTAENRLDRLGELMNSPDVASSSVFSPVEKDKISRTLQSWGMTQDEASGWLAKMAPGQH